MTKRETALELIRIEVAKEGKATHYAIRHYVENRISRDAFNEAVRQGLKQYEAREEARINGPVERPTGWTSYYGI